MSKIYNLIILVFLFCLINNITAQDTVFYKTGEIEWIGKKENNLQVGKWKRFNKSGDLITEIEYLKNNKFFIVDYKKRGNKELKTTYNGYYDKNKKEVLHGESRSYIDGNIQLISNYSNGKWHGKWQFYINDTLEKTMYYKNNLLDGKYKELYSTGQLKLQGIYKDGNKKRTWTEFYENGQIKNKGKYLPSFWEISYIDNISFEFQVANNKGEVLNEKDYPYQVREFFKLINALSKGEYFTMPYKIYYKDGKWKYFDEQGNIKKTEIFKQGRLISSTDPELN